MTYEEAFESAVFWSTEKNAAMLIVKLPNGQYVRCTSAKSWPRSILIGEVRRGCPR